MLQLSEQAGTGILVVYDDVDVLSGPLIERAIDLAAGGQNRVIVDLRPCSYFGAFGVGMLTRVKELYRDRLVVLVAPGTITERLFQITGTTRSLGIHVSDEPLGQWVVRETLPTATTPSSSASHDERSTSQATRATARHRDEFTTVTLD